LPNLNKKTTRIKVKGKNALHRAAQGDHGNIVAYLLAHNPPSFSGAKTFPHDFTALHFGAEEGHDDIVAQLLAHKPALINDMTHYGDTALHLAAREGHNKIVQQLLSIKPGLANVRNFQNHTALHEAIISMKGNNEVVEQLLPLTDPFHLETAMVEAASKGHVNIVARLVALKPSLVDIHKKDWYQETPLHLAAKNGHEEVVAQLLAFSPQSCNARARDDLTALHLAARSGHDKIVERLLAHSPALIDATDSLSETALFLTTRKGHETTVLLLLAHNPDSIDVKCGSSNLLHVAAFGGHAKIVAELLARRPSMAVKLITRAGRLCFVRPVKATRKLWTCLLSPSSRFCRSSLFPFSSSLFPLFLFSCFSFFLFLFPSFLFSLFPLFLFFAMVSAGSASRLRRQHSAAFDDRPKACSGSTGVGNEP